MGLGERLRHWLGGRSEAKPPVSARRKVTGIRADVLRTIAAVARDSHPHEMGAALRAEDGIISELILVPGTIGGDRHAFLNTWRLPVDASLVGTVHSHPSPNAQPSDADRQFFSHFGHTHLIMAYPYTLRSWIAYDLTGEPIHLDIVDDA